MNDYEYNLNNEQDVFDVVAKHLLTQGKRSEGVTTSPAGYSHTACLYRGPGGLSCAVGCLIKDEAYSGSFESDAVDNLSVRDALKASGVASDDDDILDTLRALQQVHDVVDPFDWRPALIGVALAKSLSTHVARTAAR